MTRPVFFTIALAAASFIAATGPALAHHRHHAPKSKLTIALEGTLAPVISGNDPAGLNGQSATVTIVASESLNPYKTTANSASYHIPAGGITVDLNGTEYKSTSKSSMIIKLGKNADTLTLNSSLDIDGFKIHVSDVSSFAGASWTKSVLQHPMPFSPSPQNLTQPASNFTYTVLGETTVLGVTGTASNSDARGADYVTSLWRESEIAARASAAQP